MMTDKDRIAALELQLASQQQLLDKLWHLVQTAQPMLASAGNASSNGSVSDFSFLPTPGLEMDILASPAAQTGSTIAAIYAINTDQGYGVQAETGATAYHAVYALTASTTTDSAAVRAEATGAGYGVYSTTPAGGKSAVYAQTASTTSTIGSVTASNTGTGYGLVATTAAGGNHAVYAQTSSTAAGNAAVFATNDGAGVGVLSSTGNGGSHAVNAQTSSTTSSTAAVRASNSGAGIGLQAIAAGTGAAVSAQHTGAGSALTATTGATGNDAISASTASTTDTKAAVNASNTGAGYAINASTGNGGNHAVNAQTSSTVATKAAVSATNSGAGYGVYTSAIGGSGVYSTVTTGTALNATATGSGTGLSATTTTGIAVNGVSSGGKAAVFDSADQFAQLHLVAAVAGTGAPTTGAHSKGEFYVDSGGALWYCTADGTPGTWLQLSATVSGGGPVFTPIAPFRLVDTVNGTVANPTAAIIDGFGTVANAEANKKTYSVTPSIPTSAKAILGYAYVHQNIDKFKVEPGYGYLTLWKGGDAYPQVVNGVEGLVTLRHIRGASASTFICLPLSATGTFHAASKYTTHLAIDVVGYFA